MKLWLNLSSTGKNSVTFDYVKRKKQEKEKEDRINSLQGREKNRPIEPGSEFSR